MGSKTVGIKSEFGKRQKMKTNTYSLRHILVNVNYVAKIFLRKPLFLFRLIKNYIKVLFSSKRLPIRFADVAVTYTCNMNCSHCSATEMGQHTTTELSVADYEKIAKKLIDAGLLAVNFTGGEPFARKDLYEIIKAFQPHKILVAVQTNGFIVNETRLKELKKIGVDSLGVSLDNSNPESHDFFRNKPGAYHKAIKTIETAVALGFKVGISYCLTHDNLYSEDREKIVELSKKYGALLNYNLASPIGFWKGQYDNLITANDRKYLLKLLEEYPQSKTDFETNYFKKGCGAIKEKLYVNAYGEVMPCPFIQVSFGNILTTPVETIRDNAFQYRYFKEYAPNCLAAEDIDFINNTWCYSKEADDMQMPLPHEKAFKNRQAALAEE